MHMSHHQCMGGLGRVLVSTPFMPSPFPPLHARPHQTINCWLDAKARPVLIFAPARHVRRLGELDEGEMVALWGAVGRAMRCAPPLCPLLFASPSFHLPPNFLPQRCLIPP